MRRFDRGFNDRTPRIKIHQTFLNADGHSGQDIESAPRHTNLTWHQIGIFESRDNSVDSESQHQQQLFEHGPPHRRSARRAHLCPHSLLRFLQRLLRQASQVCGLQRNCNKCPQPNETPLGRSLFHSRQHMIHEMAGQQVGLEDDGCARGGDLRTTRRG